MEDFKCRCMFMGTYILDLVLINFYLDVCVKLLLHKSICIVKKSHLSLYFSCLCILIVEVTITMYSRFVTSSYIFHKCAKSQSCSVTF